MSTLRRTVGSLGRLVAMLAVAFVALQVYFAARIALMAIVDPQSTTFQRSEAWRLLVETGRITWAQRWTDYDHISANVKRAVIASEDAGFADHSGVEWEAIEKAWEKNLRAEAVAERVNARAGDGRTARAAKVVGGSTITQQLAKNLFLTGERTWARKAQEFAITLTLEALLSKQRIYEIYLNNVEWGEGLFGIEAAAHYYYRTSAAQLGAYPAARLAVMLPAPKRFEKRPGSAYVNGRAATIAARMGTVEAP